MLVKAQSLVPEAYSVIHNKATECPKSGEYNDFTQSGSYLCRNCGIILFRAKDKFDSGCGWPSFDQDFSPNVLKQPDADGKRTEILCKRCNAHLGHVFYGERIAPLNTRYCVNSIALDFVENTEVLDSEEAILAAGCFWGVEYYFKKLPGVLKTQVGYIGGSQPNPTYQEVSGNKTNHLEAVRVVYDPKVVSYKEVLKYFFEIHDPTQTDGQGPDLGMQYLSAIFYYDARQLSVSKEVIQLLDRLGYKVVTMLYPVSIFWAAEDYHQNYYTLNLKVPYCHKWQKKF